MRTEEACNYKKLYDTQFEAERAASITAHKFGEEMTVYECGKHYHLAHVDPSLRNKHIKPPRIDWCKTCHVYINPKNYDKHILKVRHLRMAKARVASIGDEPSNDT